MKNIIKIASVYLLTTGCQYLKTQLERIKKSLQKTFKDFGVEIVAESDLRTLDLTLNFNDRSFRPCHKPDDIIQYINKESSHPPNFINHMPASVENGFQTILSMKNYFKNQLFIIKIH